MRSLARLHVPALASSPPSRHAEVFTYSHFKEKLASTLPTDECTKLANFFKIPKDQTDAIQSSDKPSENLLHALEEKGILQPYNVQRLRDAFVDLEMDTFCLHLAEIYQKTRGSRFVKEDISDLTASFKVMESKLGMRSDEQEMTDEHSHVRVALCNMSFTTLKDIN
ncbi:hypothetical protein HOLleu_21839 [Holothuria leucospilota]|uniref:Uncharacterized protein n=1 Tax=Holothuria leucospilota TaxID=206669 RepID=A0A9Q1BXU4_HOLLE|nr:hypothetical protein HOLleu_21839 [Holothuria leucospilota]